MYFFPDKNSKMYYNDYILVKNTIDDFCIECDLNFDDKSYLLEGYLYGNLDKMQFLISDILFKGDKLIDFNYYDRMQLVNSLFFNKIQKMCNLNNLISISIHHYITIPLLKIFLNNFIWKTEVICIETVCNFEKKINFLEQNKHNNNINNDCDVSIKKITKTKVSDIYNVCNLDTSNNEGILYISTLKMSKHLSSLFKENDELNLKCAFNKHFQKWYVIV